MKYFSSFFLLLLPLASFSKGFNNPQPSIEAGAQVFQERCVLCHGQAGMGDGLIALTIKDYPNTNLRGLIKANTREEIHLAVVFGGSNGDLSKFMPPMGNDLTWTEIESVVDFVELLRTDLELARSLTEVTTKDLSANIKLGKHLFESRCALCHGELGRGDGRMAKIIKSPAPANLSLSNLSVRDLKLIISKGGAALNRSPKMPPWGEQFGSYELESLILYVKELRK